MEWALLADVPEPVRREILDRCRRRGYETRQSLFYEGDPSDGMHLITIGHVVIRVSTTSGDVATLAVFGPGEAVGEHSLIRHGGRRSASAIALDRVETLYLGRPTFDELRAEHPSVDKFLIALLDARLRAVTDRLLAALYLPVHVRVAQCLDDMLATFGGDVIPLTQDDIASMAGTTRPTTNRILRHAAELGAIRLARGHITVTDREILRHMRSVLPD